MRLVQLFNLYVFSHNSLQIDYSLFSATIIIHQHIFIIVMAYHLYWSQILVLYVGSMGLTIYKNNSVQVFLNTSEVCTLVCTTLIMIALGIVQGFCQETGVIRPGDRSVLAREQVRSTQKKVSVQQTGGLQTLYCFN